MKHPTRKIKDICELTPPLLLKWGVEAVLCDLDNTLAGYGTAAADGDIKSWLTSVREAGIIPAVVSNASEERAAAFCEPLDLPYIARAAKPGAKKLRSMLKNLGVSPERSLMVGDQLFTDVLAGRKAGVRTVLVDPRTKNTLVNIRRWIETPFLPLFCKGAKQ